MTKQIKPRKTARGHSKSSTKPKRPKALHIPRSGPAFQKLAGVMARLRAPGGCPWDREQTHATLRTYLIEEAYEVLDALDSRDDAKLAEELGDLLLQVLFHAQIAHEEGRFDISDVICEIHNKMIRRHPHVFGSKQAKDSAEVLRNWEIIKKQERQKKTAASDPASPHESLLDGIPHSLPALLEGLQLTRRAARVGFDWHNVDGIFDKLEEETKELREILHQGDPARIEAELGDILFVAVNLARFLKIDPEIAMKKANAKFSRRFRSMEHIATGQGTFFAKISRDQMESLWEQAKLQEQKESKKN